MRADSFAANIIYYRALSAQPTGSFYKGPGSFIRDTFRVFLCFRCKAVYDYIILCFRLCGGQATFRPQYDVVFGYKYFKLLFKIFYISLDTVA